MSTRYTFTDQEYDDEFGFYNFKARLYDPLLGRFLSPDSIVQAPGDPQTLNRYSYCGNNPLVYTDPSGHFSVGNLFKSFFVGVVAAAAFCAAAVAIVGTGGFAMPVAAAFYGGTAFELGLAGAIAGAVGGGVGAALNGGNVLQGALVGAAIGAATGAIGGGFAAHLRETAGLGNPSGTYIKS